MPSIEKIETKYSANVMEHFNHPRNVGSIKSENNVGTGVVGAPACGDVLKFQVKINKDGIIEDAKFRAFGCGSAIASSSLATELVKGKSIEDSLRITNDVIAQKLSLPPIKLHCSMLAEDAIKAAIKDFKSKNSILS